MAALFAFCAWLSAETLLAPSKAMDAGIAQICDFARPQDVRKVEGLLKYIGSPWWRDYAESRLVGKMEGSPSEIAAAIFSRFGDDGIRAYMLASQAVHTPGLADAFSMLPPREAELASLIYALRKGMLLEPDVFENFDKSYMEGAPPRLRRHYGDILLTEAFKCMNAGAADLILRSLKHNPFSWRWLFVAKGTNPAEFKSGWKKELEALAALYAYSNPEGGSKKPELRNMLKAGWSAGIYDYIGIRAWADAVWAAGAEDDAMLLLGSMYSRSGKPSRVKPVRTSSLTNTVQWFGVRGRLDQSLAYIYTNAGTDELVFGLVAEAALSAARMGRMDEAVEFIGRFNGLGNRLKTALHLPTFPEKWAHTPSLN